MTWILRILLVSVGTVGTALLLRRSRPVYPAPESLIIRLPDDVSDRFLPLEGGVNFRDVGGYRTADGRRVRRGLVFRSGTLARLTEADLAYLSDMGVKLVCDLRGHEEVTAEPDRLPVGDAAPLYLHTPLAVEDDRRQRLRALLFNPASLAPMMTDMYTRVMLVNNARLYGDLLTRLADPANLPAVFHCTAGKDRTGLAAALLLSVLGVPDETILADYSLSNQYYADFFRYAAQYVHRLRWLGVRADDLYPLLVADPQNIQTVLTHLRAQYGSVENYLTTAAGMSAEAIEALKANLLE